MYMHVLIFLKKGPSSILQSTYQKEDTTIEPQSTSQGM